VSQATTPVHPSPRIWYGWVVLGVVFLAMCSLIAVRATFGIFFKSIAGEFGWTRAQTAGAFSAGLIGQAIGSPLAGALMDRWGIRRTMAAGTFFAGLAVLSGAFVGALWHFYLMYFALCVGFSGATWVAQVPTLSNWFVRRRGTAIGISNSAQGFAFASNVVTPWLILAVGWRWGYAAWAAVILLVTFPAVALLHRDHPAEAGTVADAPFLSPEEARAVPAPAPPRAGRGRGGAARAVLSARFALIASVYATIAYVFASTIVHLVPHATDQGFSPEGGGAVFAVWGALMVVSNLASTVSDRIGRTPAYLAGAALGFASSILLATYLRGDPPAQFYAGAVLSGLALGFVRPTASSILADHFAGPGFGRINGAVMACFALFGSTGPWLTGALYDRLGGYREGFFLIAGFYLLGGALVAALARMGRENTPRNKRFRGG